MAPYLRTCFLLLWGVVFVPFNFQAVAQITAPESVARISVSYFPQEGMVLDSVYLFAGSNASFIAGIKDYGGQMTFNWQKYNPADKDFGPAFKTETGSVSTVTGLEDGAYRVTIQGTPEGERSFIAWCYNYKGVNIKLKKDNNGNLPFGSYTCNNLFLECDVEFISDFNYYDPYQHEEYTDFIPNLLNKYFVFEWASEPSLGPSVITNGKSTARVVDPPVEDTRFSVTVTDPFTGQEFKDNLFHASIRPRASLKAEPFPDENNNMSAPLKVLFTNESNNSDRAVLILDDGNAVIDPFTNSAEYIYNIPRPNSYNRQPYKPLLKVEKWGVVNGVQVPVCSDSISVDIEVKRSELKVPNVFTPGGAHPYFKPYGVSIKTFELTVTSRSGAKIYSYKGNDLNSWQGWDGTADNGTKVADGPYIYIIKATGWDPDETRPNMDKSYEDGVYKGFFYLFRAK